MSTIVDKAPAGVGLIGVTKRFSDVVAVDEVSLDIEPGEFVSLLGPSGCGKTTTLRMIAGFEFPDEGDIMLGGRSILSTPPYRRDSSMVFQDYALFPHRTVAQNIAFGLRMRNVPKSEISSRVEQTLEMLELKGLGGRKPDQLSGGQQQRVALGRALIVGPSVLLLDEPLGALDLQLRKQMQLELKRIHRELGITFVYVTHDQEEAITMSDRIAVMNEGRVEQYASVIDIYQRPETAFVAQFIGDANLLSATVRESGNTKVLSFNQDRLVMEAGKGVVNCRSGEKVGVVVRPENVKMGCDAGKCDNTYRLEVTDVIFAGSFVRVIGVLEGVEVRLTTTVSSMIRRGDRVAVGWDAEDVVVINDLPPGKVEDWRSNL